jgi:hypothetical protein
MTRSIATSALAGAFVLVQTTCVFAQVSGGKPHPGGSSAMTPMLGSSPPLDCTVGMVNAAANAFSCTSTEGVKTFTVYATTTYKLSSGGTGLAGLKSGMPVAVGYHGSGTALIADSVASAP